MNLVALKEERGLTSLQGRASDTAGFTVQDKAACNKPICRAVLLNSEVEERKKKKVAPHSWGLWLGQIIKLAKKR